MPGYRCVICEKELSEEGIEKLTNCPNCDSPLKAVHTDYDLSLTINWHELRLLAQWAENFSDTVPANSPDYMAFVSIMGRLAAMQPKGQPALTKTEAALQSGAKGLMNKLLSWGLVASDGRSIIRVPSPHGA